MQWHDFHFWASLLRITLALHWIKDQMQTPVIFDGRNLYDPKSMLEQGISYYSIGRPVQGSMETEFKLFKRA